MLHPHRKLSSSAEAQGRLVARPFSVGDNAPRVSKNTGSPAQLACSRVGGVQRRPTSILFIQEHTIITQYNRNLLRLHSQCNSQNHYYKHDLNPPHDLRSGRSISSQCAKISCTTLPLVDTFRRTMSDNVQRRGPKDLILCVYLRLVPSKICPAYRSSGHEPTRQMPSLLEVHAA